jgi:hypothetical protein
MPKYYELGTTEEWREATKLLRNLSGKEQGYAALEMCKQMLSETPDPATVETVECEHDFQPSARFPETNECTKCGTMCESIPEEVTENETGEWYDEAQQ